MYIDYTMHVKYKYDNDKKTSCHYNYDPTHSLLLEINEYTINDK